MAPIIHGNGYNMAQREIFGALQNMGVSINQDGSIALSESLLDSVRPKMAPEPALPSTTTFSSDLSAFREPAPQPPPPEVDMDIPMTRREVVALVQRLQSGQTPPPYSQAPAPAYPSFRSEAVLSVLEAQIRDAWRRRGRA
jgi:hypothetical protein